MGSTTYRDALRKALVEGMAADPNVVLIGEEVGRYGGAYGLPKASLTNLGLSESLTRLFPNRQSWELLLARPCRDCVRWRSLCMSILLA